MCRRELCKMARVNREHTAKGQKGGSNKVEKCSWPQERRERETAESPPQEHRNKPSSHADLAACGGETEDGGKTAGFQV